MKHLTTLFITLSVTITGYAQNIKFKVASPQPVIQDVYGGTVVSGDLDNDGDIDIIQSGIGYDIMGFNAEAAVFLNDGNGNFFLEEQDFNHFSLTEKIFMEDVNNDGHLDVIITAGNRTDLYFNDGTAKFIYIENTPFQTANFNDLIFGDVDNDGDIDVIHYGHTDLENPFSNLYFNDGNGSFTLSSNLDFTPFFLPQIEFIDFEGDGDLDLLSFGRNADNAPQFQAYENDGLGNYSVFSTSNITPLVADEISIGDIDNDGDEDVFTTGTNINFKAETTLYLNDGFGQFLPVESTPFPNMFAGTNAFSDLDNDNDLDIVLIGSMDGGIPNIFSIIFENHGNNTFVASDSLSGEYIAATTINDINGDGKKDIILQGFNNYTNVYSNETILSSVKDNIQIPFSISPNPSRGNFLLEWEHKPFQRIEIIDQSGKTVYSNTIKNQQSHHVDLQVPSGIYIVQLIGNNSTSTQQLFIKN